MKNIEIKEMQKFRVREELKLEILKIIANFNLKEEPDYKKLSNDDIINVLSSLIVRRTN